MIRLKHLQPTSIPYYVSSGYSASGPSEVTFFLKARMIKDDHIGLDHNIGRPNDDVICLVGAVISKES